MDPTKSKSKTTSIDSKNQNEMNLEIIYNITKL